MAPVRRLSRDVWEKRLRDCGCYPAEGLTKLNTAEWWRWPFPATPFTVPVDSEGYMEQGAYFRLMADMAELAPADWKFNDPYNI